MDTKQMMQEQYVAIKANLEELTAAVNAYSAVFEKHASSDDLATQISQFQVRMLESVKQMQSAVYGPLNMVMIHFEECLRSSSLRALLEMGVLDCLPADGQGISAAEVAGKLSVDEALLGLSFDAGGCTYVHRRAKYKSVYPHSKLQSLLASCSKSKLQNDVSLTSVKNERQNTWAMSEFLKKDGYRNPNSLTNNPYTYAHDTKGLGMFDFLLQDPVRFKNFNVAMQAQSAQTLRPYSLFPFKDELGKIETTDETVLVVDVGGGNGQATTAIRGLCLGIKGKMILQDQAQVIEGITEPLPGVEKMAHDFFKPQPIKGMMRVALSLRDADISRRSPILHAPMLTRLARERMRDDTQEHRHRNETGIIKTSYI
ncbi:O-methyltransferase afvC [Hyphodiscus hymeniophilus]|uniref:O-methyltransferase afvC n=1 Tax=Hyphodiscus hymeniophilus TaxID=353542 RepID=A0A9P7AYJ4_9HELO|nr:O-methyltransferase afvC [Hyphodiscus hymeniophilus]